jgi:hypothetical protein
MAPFDPMSVCRLCASEKDLCVNIFSEDGVKNNLQKKIRLCLPIIVSIIERVLFAFMLRSVGNPNYSHSYKSPEMRSQNFRLTFSYIKYVTVIGSDYS